MEPYQQDGGKSQERRDHLCGGGAGRHQYRSADLGETLMRYHSTVSADRGDNA